MTLTFRAGQGLSFHELMRIAAVKAGTYNFPDSAGGAVTTNSGLTVNIASITGASVLINSVVGANNYVGSTLTAGVSSSTLDRIDTIYYDGTATLAIAPGAPVLTSGTLYPVPPTLSAGQIAVANLFVGKGYTSFSASDIDDRRDSLGTPTFFDSERTAFRANRRLIAEYSAQALSVSGTQAPAGVGFQQVPVDSSDGLFTINGEPMFKFSVATAGAGYLHLTPLAGVGAILAPNHSPRMLVRGVFPAASANVTSVLWGFVSTTTTTPNGAYLRIVTTGNVFFVTRQGGTETTTDLGVLARTSTALGFEIETVDAGVTWVCRNQAGTVLATHTTNVPTAATGLSVMVWGQTATGAVPWGVMYAHVEGTFA